MVLIQVLLSCVGFRGMDGSVLLMFATEKNFPINNQNKLNNIHCLPVRSCFERINQLSLFALSNGVFWLPSSFSDNFFTSVRYSVNSYLLLVTLLNTFVVSFKNSEHWRNIFFLNEWPKYLGKWKVCISCDLHKLPGQNTLLCGKNTYVEKIYYAIHVPNYVGFKWMWHKYIF